MKEIDVSTRKHPNKFAIVDDDDYEWLSLFKWTAEERRNTFYACRSGVNSIGGTYLIRMHRDIIRARSFEDVDHENLNGLDNRKENLRICSDIQNQQNRPQQRERKNGNRYKGVSKRKNRSQKDTHFTYITVDMQRHNLGTYETDVEAAKVYDSAALYHFGGWARLNFPANETIPRSVEEIKAGIQK